MSKSIIYTKNAPEPIGPYNQAILVDQTLYISGQIPLDPKTGELVGDSDPETQTKQVMSNLGAILLAADMSFKDVIKCSIFVTDLSWFSKVNTIYGLSFESGIEPARECVEVSNLPKNVLVEISCIAHK